MVVAVCKHFIKFSQAAGFGRTLDVHDTWVKFYDFLEAEWP